MLTWPPIKKLGNRRQIQATFLPPGRPPNLSNFLTFSVDWKNLGTKKFNFYPIKKNEFGLNKSDKGEWSLDLRDRVARGPRFGGFWASSGPVLLLTLPNLVLPSLSVLRVTLPLELNSFFSSASNRSGFPYGHQMNGLRSPTV